MSTSDSAEWSPETQAILRSAGWYPERRERERVAGWRRALSTPGGFELSAAAERVLEEFGDLRVERRGPGLEVARGGFELDPALAEGEEDRFARLGRPLGANLFPLGEALGGHVFLAIDEAGRVYLVGDEIHALGSNIYQALDNLLMGRQPRG
jgi:hypothetical protein